MQDLVGHIVRRAVHSTTTVMVNGDKVKMPQLPPWGAAIVWGTLAVFMVVMISWQYTLGDVVGTLTMIETPSASMRLPASEEEANAKDDALDLGDITIDYVPGKPITSGIRSTVNHITSIGGRYARWRAFVPALLYGLFLSSLAGLVTKILPIPGRALIGKILATVILARMHMAWTHAVISMPSSLRWYQRLAPMKSVKNLWVPATVNAVATDAVIYLTYGFALIMGFCANSMMEKHGKDGVPKGLYAVFALQALAVVVFAVVMSLFLALPAAVTLARVEASMLPEDQETIVPFDRSFGNKVVPAILGGSGAIGFIDAWRTFNWEARRRLIKLYLKTFAIMVVLFFVMMHVVGFEMWAILGPELGKTLAELKRSW